MNQAEATRAIFDHWVGMWPSLSGGIPYSLDNTAVPIARPCAVVNIISLDSEQYTLGPRAKVLREGMIDVRIYDKVGVGRGGADELATHARTIFERRRIGTGGDPAVGSTRRVVTHAGSVNELRRDREAGGLWVLSVTFPYEFYDVRRVP